MVNFDAGEDYKYSGMRLSTRTKTLDNQINKHNV